MRLFLSPAALALLALALWPGADDDPCGIAGTYALDRAPIVADVVASMERNLADLGPRPPDGSRAATEWAARQEAYQSVRADALGGGVVPYLTLAFSDDGRVTHRETGPDADDRHRETGRWTADAACRTLTLDLGDAHPTTARIDGDRLVFDHRDAQRGRFSGASFDRVR